MKTSHISWDTYFMGVAQLSALRSKDPKTQVGACIVNQDNHIVGVGYNGMPNGCSDEEFPWTKSSIFEDNKHSYVVHAELNAILNSTSSLKGCKIYITLFPCNECAKAIIQSGIKEIIYLDCKEDKEYVQASLRMFKATNIKITKMESKLKIRAY